MTFDVVFKYQDGFSAKRVIDFLPRVGDTIVDDMDVIYEVKEVRYCIPNAGDKYIQACVFLY